MRDKQQRSLRDVERASGLKSGYLSQLERGEVQHPSPTVLKKIADGYTIPMAVVLQWSGYVSDAPELTPNQAVALSTIGDPSDHELKALKAIIDLLRANGSAAMAAASALDLELDDVTREEIRGYALALLREADALGERPTPVDHLCEAAELVRVGDITLDPRDRKRLVEQLGGWVDQAWHRLLGSMDFRADAIWIKPGLHPKRERFVLSHEVGHAILPAHRAIFARPDDKTRIKPWVNDFVEREANQAAAELLFQGDQLRDEADSSPITLDATIGLSDRFGASIIATVRRIAEDSRRDVAVAEAHKSDHGLGPTHLYASPGFAARYGWQRDTFPRDTIRPWLHEATSLVAPRFYVWNDARGRSTVVRVEALFTGYASIVLIVRETGLRRAAFQRRAQSPVPLD